MIKFFRKIRKKFLEQGKTSKYLSYALGEIILVVIGILIALQINNWNEERLDNNREKITIQNLNTEFKENLRDLDSINIILQHTILATENDLQNSGGLSELNNKNLKILLFNWSRFFKELQETMNQTEETNINLIEYIREHGSLRNIDAKSKKSGPIKQ